MKIISVEQLQSQPLIESILQLNSAVDQNTDNQYVTEKLTQLYKQLHQTINELEITDPQEKLTLLLNMFYYQWQFKINPELYCIKNSFLESILKNRQGLPIGLGLLLHHFATKLDLPVTITQFPTQMILKVTFTGHPPFFIDPSDGSFPKKSLLQKYLATTDGFVRLTPEHLIEAEPTSLLVRWLVILKNNYLNQKEFNNALICSDLILEINPDNGYEHRDRGYIFQQLQCDHIALKEYQTFVEQYPDDPTNVILQLQIAKLEPLNYIH